MAAATPVKTTVTELPESRVRVEAEVPAEEVTRRMAETARRLGKDLRIQGFRRGKVPAPVVIQRVGREAVLDEAVRAALGRWYIAAIDEAGIVPVGDPSIDLSAMPASDKDPLTFTIEIGVRPKAQLGEYKGVKVAKREPAADPEQIDAQIEQLRQSHARLETVERPAATGDFLVMDFVGSVDGEEFAGGSGRDQMVELGRGQLVPGFEEQLEGLQAGDEKEVAITFPDDYGAEHLAGKQATFQVTAKEVKEKQLPELDDEFASDAAGFDTLDELREDIASKLKEADEAKAVQDFRQAVLDAVVENATIEVPESLVEARAQEMFERMMHSLSHQGITKEAFLQISQSTEEEQLEQAKPEAEQALRREAVVAAIVEAEDLEPSDGDVLDSLQAMAAREGMAVEKLRDRLEKDGRLAELRGDLAARQAVDLIVEHADTSG
ncbi:MAG TPA: trigger factor [Baekduia sp.]|nr:trigger factor [Baekduia sp.]